MKQKKLLKLQGVLTNLLNTEGFVLHRVSKFGKKRFITGFIARHTKTGVQTLRMTLDLNAPSEGTYTVRVQDEETQMRFEEVELTKFGKLLKRVASAPARYTSSLRANVPNCATEAQSKVLLAYLLLDDDYVVEVKDGVLATD